MSLKIFEWKDLDKKEFLVNFFNLSSSYFFPLHSHQNHWEIVYCQEGSFHHQINGKVYKQEEGEICFIRESDTHLLKGKDFKYMNIAFSGAWMESLRIIAGDDLLLSLTDGNAEPPFRRVSLKEREMLEEKIAHLSGKERSGRSDFQFSYFLHFLFDLFLPDHNERVRGDDWPDWFNDLLIFIGKEVYPLPDLGRVVEESCRCLEHVSRSFRKYLGVTPTAYLKEVRLKKAAELLRSTNYAVKEICHLCSYENANYFHKQFREKFGETPGEYRKRKARRIH